MSHEFSPFGTAPSPPDDRDHSLAMYLPGMRLAASQLPDEVGKENVKAYPGKRQQGMEGTCVGHGVRTVKQTQERRQRKYPSKMARVPEMGPRGIYHWTQVHGGYVGEEGAYLRDALHVTHHQGTPREKDWPYVARYDGQWQPQDIGQPSANMARYAKAWKIGAYARLRTLDEILFTLEHGGPVLMAMELHESFMDTGSDGIVPAPSGQSLGGHCMAFLGASQSERRLVTPNSWGDWGDDGTCYLDFDHFMGGYHEAWAMPDVLTA